MALELHVLLKSASCNRPLLLVRQMDSLGLSKKWLILSWNFAASSFVIQHRSIKPSKHIYGWSFEAISKNKKIEQHNNLKITLLFLIVLASAW